MKKSKKKDGLRVKQDNLKQGWYNYLEERKLAKEGKTKKSRLNERERYRKVEHRLNLAIIAVSLALIIVLLFTFFI